MCRLDRFPNDEGYPEKSLGLATQSQGAIWNAEDTPMLLHLFEYIVRKSLLAWWKKMADGYVENTR